MDNLLTPRQVEVLQMVADGKTDREIALELGVSVHTVLNAMQRGTYAYKNGGILEALDAASRAHAVAEGFRRGIIE